MTIYLAADHGGFALKESIKKHLLGSGMTVIDCGNDHYDAGDDYPDFIKKAAQLVHDNAGSRGIVCGGSGQGEAMVANRFSGVRCMLFYGPVMPKEPLDLGGTVSTDPFENLRTSREHNDSNMLSLGARLMTEAEALKAVDIWLQTPFTGEERHARRIAKF
jgi:ribose 5-phosphate isomerase B